IRTWRKIRAADADDEGQTPVAPVQPDTSLALTPGEMLSLTRTSRRTGIIGLLTTYIGSILLFAIFDFLGATQLLSNLPIWFLWKIAPVSFIAQPRTPSTLDWLTIAYPLLTAIFIGPIAIWGTLSNRRLTIFANDHGVTVQRSFHRSHFIPWRDIDVFLRTPRKSYYEFVGTYNLHGREHSLTFELSGPQMAANNSQPIYEFEGGYLHYAEQARRLLATVCERSFTPLHLSTLEPEQAMAAEALPDEAQMAPEQAGKLPPAPADWQPDPDVVEDATRFRPIVVLREQIAGVSLIRDALLFIPMFAGVAAVLVVPLALVFPAHSFTRREYLMGAAIITLFIVTLGFMVGMIRQRRKLPMILADDEGIVSKMADAHVPIALRWRDIRAWVLVPPTTGKSPTATYIIFGVDKRLTWTERAGARLGGRAGTSNRVSAYRVRAEQLHALIVARTGQPLRMIQPASVPEQVIA
ncbi:MAG TPA: hypothetical protein VKB76_03955, partial [Ktedonobacterales bacterium]|nr:hypothetical protein [Ktedonobacterales bacterium]